MQNWLDSVAGPGYASALLWTFAALVLLAIVLVIVRLIRSMTFGTFVAGGRNRKTRLAVMDATAVDSHRRLVLIRRDDVEHLLLIGGPTDVVVERDIKLVSSRRPAAAPETNQVKRSGAEAHHAQRDVRPHQQQKTAPVGHDAPGTRPVPNYPTIALSPAPAAAVATEKPGSYKPLKPDLIDDTLMSELEVSLDALSTPEPAAAAKAPPSLDDEMTRLLGELSSHKKQV
jgi:hypothetical protein